MAAESRNSFVLGHSNFLGFGFWIWNCRCSPAKTLHRASLESHNFTNKRKRQTTQPPAHYHPFPSPHCEPRLPPDCQLGADWGGRRTRTSPRYFSGRRFAFGSTVRHRIWGHWIIVVQKKLCFKNVRWSKNSGIPNSPTKSTYRRTFPPVHKLSWYEDCMLSPLPHRSQNCY